MKRKEALAKQDLVRKAREISAAEISRLQGIIDDAKGAANMKKKQAFLMLKEHMDTDLQRRAAEKGTEAQENKDFMDRLTRREEAMTIEEADLELRAREELVNYYASMTEEAARREQKAIWQIRRRRLEASRLDFFEDDNERWVNAMKTGEVAPIPLSMGEDGLPLWATRQAGASVSAVTDTGEKQMDMSDTETTPTNESTLSATDKDSVISATGSVSLDHSADSAKKVMEDGGPMLIDLNNTMKSAKVLSGARPQDDVTEKQETESSEKIGAVHTSVKMTENIHALSEAEEGAFRPKMKFIPGMSANLESQESDHQPKSIIISGKSANIETEEVEYQCKLKIIPGMSANAESQQEESRPQLKVIPGMSANIQSTEEQYVAKIMKTGHHASQESTAIEWKIKKCSTTGHASDMSNWNQDYVIPRLRRVEGMDANRESDWRSFAIKPKIKMNKENAAFRESEPVKEPMRFVKKSGDQFASRESNQIDLEELRKKRFQKQNVYGHATDSSVQKLMYREKYDDLDKSDIVDSPQTFAGFDFPTVPVDTYEDNFDFLDEFPSVDILSGLSAFSSNYGDYGVSKTDEAMAYQYIPLPVLMTKSVTEPLLAQISLVNESILNYFSVELCVEQHFDALKKYLFMEDGDFAHILSDQLFEKLVSCRRPQEMLNPIYLNRVLKKAVTSSARGDDKLSDNLVFNMKFMPKILDQNAANALDCLQLQYMVTWPLNIVITDNCVAKYGEVFSFMLQLKRIVWVLKDIWYKLKRDATVHKVDMTSHFRQLHIFKQEMQHFVKVMQAYISNQVIHLTGQEFRAALNKHVRDLDDLHEIHVNYLNKALFRCLLTKNAGPVMKIVQDIFTLILKFSAQLAASSWSPDPKSGRVVNSAFSNLHTSYKTFREYSSFLFKVVSKLSARGYQPHLQELLLRLNFNHYYKED